MWEGWGFFFLSCENLEKRERRKKKLETLPQTGKKKKKEGILSF